MAQSNPSTISATAAQRKFGDLIRRVFNDSEELIIQKDGLPVAAVIPMSEYEVLKQERMNREERLRRFEEIARQFGKEAEEKGYTEEQLMAELEETKRQVYEEWYGRRSK